MLEGRNLNYGASVDLNNAPSNIWQEILKESMTKKDLRNQMFLYSETIFLEKDH